MEKVDTSARPDWLADDQAGPVPTRKDAASKAVPWRTPGSRSAAVPKVPKAPAAAVRAVPAPSPKRHFWETHVLPLCFLLVFVLVVGGYLAGWHLG